MLGPANNRMYNRIKRAGFIVEMKCHAMSPLGRQATSSRLAMPVQLCGEPGRLCWQGLVNNLTTCTKPSRHQASFAFGQTDGGRHAGIELQEVSFDAVAEDHAVASHL